LAVLGLAWFFSGAAASDRVLQGSSAPAPSVTTDSSGPARQVLEGADTVSATPGVDPAPAATAAYARGDYAAALLGFQQAMTEHPDDPAAANNVGQVLVRLGRPAEAVPLFEKAVSGRPTEWSYRFNLARAYALLRDWPAAVASYREADRLFPDDGPTLYNFGLSLQQTGSDEEAAAVLERAVSSTPGDPTFVLALARSYQRLSRTDDARRTFEKFLEMSPQSADAAAARQALTSLGGSQAEPAPPPQPSAPSAAAEPSAG
jgi:Flp pilus assembly protein TadD